MRTVLLLACASLGLSLTLRAADVCDPKDLQGTYGFQLSGKTTISGDSKPVTSLGRMVLDGQGAITGYSSAMMAGFLLGNPVNGTYETAWDCTASWSLQDDSGALQHFKGTVTPGGKLVRFQQTDPGGAQHGILEKTAGECKVADLRKEYEVAIAGSYTPMQAGQAPSTIDLKGLMTAAANGAFTLSRSGSSAAPGPVAVALDPDCVAHLDLTLPSDDGKTTTIMTLRGMLVDGGRQILAIQTDPGWMVSAKFTAH